ncbi:MAG: SURF1 family protein [Caldimonas sp.]
MGNYRHGLVVLCAALAGTLLAARLGLWQLDRAATKEALQSVLEGNSRLPALDASSLPGTPAEVAALRYRPVRLDGRWLAERTIFLDNRQMDGKTGFYVVTPLLLAGRPEALLVQRGWVQRDFIDRAALPKVQTPAGPVSVVGSVAPPPSRLFEFDAAASGTIRQNLDLAAFAREASISLLPMTVLQRDSPGAADGLARRWPPPASDVHKHYGYAFQWFAIAAAIASLYVWHRFIRPLASRR